jgi:hypothetical protein
MGRSPTPRPLPPRSDRWLGLRGVRPRVSRTPRDRPLPRGKTGEWRVGCLRGPFLASGAQTRRSNRHVSRPRRVNPPRHRRRKGEARAETPDVTVYVSEQSRGPTAIGSSSASRIGVETGSLQADNLAFFGAGADNVHYVKYTVKWPRWAGTDRPVHSPLDERRRNEEQRGAERDARR